MDGTPELIRTSFSTFRLIQVDGVIRELSMITEQPERIISETAELLKMQLEEFFVGKRKKFDFKLDPQGTPFQRAIWSVTSDIPYGETLTYGQTTAMAGYPGANRACGQAMKRNPIIILIPCHRVTGTGWLGGYGGFPEIKRKLLILENPGISSSLLRTS